MQVIWCSCSYNNVSSHQDLELSPDSAVQILAQASTEAGWIAKLNSENKMHKIE